MIVCYLTCADDTEADKIANILLEKKLIACARKSAVVSSYWWDGKINHDDEILLMMETLEEKFDEIEKVVSTLHSYEAFVLTAIPVVKTTHATEKWLKEALCIED